MRFLLNRAPVAGPWGGGNNFVKALVEELNLRGHSVTYKIDSKIDVIFAVDPRYDELGLSLLELVGLKQSRGVKLFYRVNECDARKGDVGIVDPLVKSLSSQADMTFFISSWLRDYHARNGLEVSRSKVIINGVGDHFFAARQARKSSDKVRVVTHHWSNNPMKGHKIYSQIDKFVSENSDYTFTYIGRSAGSLPNSNVLSPLSGEKLAKTLADHDVYVSGSLHDPGPNHITESLACGLPTYACEDSGGAVEMVGEDHLYSDFDEIRAILIDRKFAANSFTPRRWSEVIREYVDEVERSF